LIVVENITVGLPVPTAAGIEAVDLV